MGSIVNILYGPDAHGALEGVAEIIEVLDYKGHGLYLVKCVFRNDLQKFERLCEWDIDWPASHIGRAGAETTTSPLLEDA